MIISYFTIAGALILGVWLFMSILTMVEERRKEGECMLSAFVKMFGGYQDREEKDPVPGKNVLLSLVEENGERKVEAAPDYVYSRGDKKLLTDEVEAAMEQKKRRALPNGTPA